MTRQEKMKLWGDVLCAVVSGNEANPNYEVAIQRPGEVIARGVSIADQAILEVDAAEKRLEHAESLRKQQQETA